MCFASGYIFLYSNIISSSMAASLYIPSLSCISCLASLQFQVSSFQLQTSLARCAYGGPRQSSSSPQEDAIQRCAVLVQQTSFLSQVHFYITIPEFSFLINCWFFVFVVIIIIIMAAGCIFKCLNGYIFYKFKDMYLFIILFICIYLLHI